MRRIVTLGLVAALALGVVISMTGCGMIAQKATEAAVEGATGVKVDSNKQTITTTDKDGNTTELSSKEGAYPDGFPSDFPQYPGGVIEAGLKGTTNGADSFTVIVNTPDSAADVFKFYVDGLEKAGWKIDQKMDGTTSETAYASLVALKDGQKVGITLTRDNDKSLTSVMIGLGPEKQ
jgi:hypothetical protein